MIRRDLHRGVLCSPPCARSIGLALALLAGLVGCIGRNPHYGGIRSDGAASDGGTSDQASRDVSLPPPEDSATFDSPLQETPIDPLPPDAGGGQADVVVSAMDATPDDGSPPADTSAPDVAGNDVHTDTSTADVTVEPPDPNCGTRRPNVDGVLNADGLVITPDGTLYYSTNDKTNGYIGRLLPTGEHLPRWVPIPGDPVTFGLAFDKVRGRLFFHGSNSGSVQVVHLGTPQPAPLPFVTGLTRVNDIAVGLNGDLFLALQGTRGVLKIAPDGTRVNVNNDPIGTTPDSGSPAGLNFWTDGTLYVGRHGTGRVMRILMRDNREIDRDLWGDANMWGNGIVFDSSKRLYVGSYSDTNAGKLVRISADGTKTDPIFNSGSYASMAFGRGQLSCYDLYIAVPNGKMIRLTTDVKGALLPF